MKIKPFWQNFINGQYVDGGAGRLPVVNPADGSMVAEIALADAADIDRAVAAARACQNSGDLAAMRPVELGRMVRLAVTISLPIKMRLRIC